MHRKPMPKPTMKRMPPQQQPHREPDADEYGGKSDGDADNMRGGERRKVAMMLAGMK